MSDRWFDEPDLGGQTVTEQVSRLRDAIVPLVGTGATRPAYALADRLCRLRPPAGSDLLTRCLVGLAIGAVDSAMRDLDASRSADGADLGIARLALAASRQPEQRRGAAQSIIEHPAATSGDVWAATELILAANPQEPVIRVNRNQDTITGSVAWASDDQPILTWISETASGGLDLVPRPTHSPNIRHGLFAASIAAVDTVVIQSRLGTRTSAVTLYAPTAPPLLADHSLPKAAGGLTVIVPVHSDADATQACFDSLLRQPGRFDVVVVDDHSPDPRVVHSALEFCRGTGARHIVNRINLGFAGSVNKALLQAGRGDVLLLNADVILSDGGLDRMRDVARSAPGIGTAMPLSNDSTVTSFPVRAGGNSPLARERAAEVDRIAWRLHGEQTVDLVTNIGFCLYIREPCLRAVGLLSPTYRRGYFEDVEFCLRAAERGFRNVALPGIYVTHAGSRSFTSSKAQLVARNSAIINTRFPDYRLRLLAEHWADPLRQHRSAIEERFPPSDPRHLVVRATNDADLELTLRHIAEARLDLLWTRTAGETSLEVRSPAGGIPQSLDFVLDKGGARRCRDYLGQLDVAGVTLAGVATLPAVLADLLSSLTAPVTVSVMSRACLARRAAEPAVTPGGESTIPISPTWTFAAADAMALAALRAFEKNPESPRPPRPPPRLAQLSSERPNLGIIAPRALAEVDLLIRSLVRPFVEAGTSRVVVFGRCIDDLALMRTGFVDVTGPVDRDEYAELFERYRIGAVLSPYRTAMFGLFDAVTAASDVPRIYFDWSGGAFEAPERDCVFDWTSPLGVVAAAFAAMPAGGADDVSPH